MYEWAKQKQTQTRAGFTIVELLIVIVVIAILATISIVAYSGIQNRANDVAVEADIAAIVKKMELVKVDLGRFPESAAEFPDGFKFSKSAYDPTQNNNYYCYDRANDIYSFGLRSKSLKGYILTSNGTNSGVGVSGAATCSAIGKTWVNDATTFVLQGYVGSSTTWSSGWKWAN